MHCVGQLQLNLWLTKNNPSPHSKKDKCRSKKDNWRGQSKYDTNFDAKIRFYIFRITTEDIPCKWCVYDQEKSGGIHKFRYKKKIKSSSAITRTVFALQRGFSFSKIRATNAVCLDATDFWMVQFVFHLLGFVVRVPWALSLCLVLYYCVFKWQHRNEGESSRDWPKLSTHLERSQMWFQFVSW